MAAPDWQLELPLFAAGCTSVAGLDEAGRGALAGPVVVGLVCLPPPLELRPHAAISHAAMSHAAISHAAISHAAMSHAVTSHDIDQISYDQIGYDQTGYDQISYEALCAELNDSKMLTESTRERLAVSIKQHALAWVTAQASAAEVDSHNVLAATHLAAKRSLAALPISLDGLVTDYLKLDTLLALLAPAKADSLSLQVAAASILAKTTRDALMRAAHKSYPHYGFVTNKGYGAKKHLQAINEHGICPLHRRTFKPVAERLVAAEPLRHFQMDASETS